MLPSEQVITRLIEEPPTDTYVHSHLTLPPSVPNNRQSSRRQLPDWLATLLARQGIEQPSDDQWQVLQGVRQQANVCLSAPAGSGRGTARLLALHQALHHTQQRYALIICLHKQHERKQLKRIIGCNDVLAPDHHLRACIYDGDTPKTQRRKIKQTPPQVLLTTPEMLHAGILAYHSGWRAFLQSLRIVVLPDLHQATGAMGIHLAHLLRRLYRLCRHYGSHPQFLTTTAPLGNLPRLTRELSGQDCTIICGETRRDYPQSRMILRVTGSMQAVTDDLTARLTEMGLTAAILQPDEQLRATSDPQLQGVVFCGLPLSWIRLHEDLARLSGHPHPSLGILILRDQTPLERYVLRYPDVYQRSWVVDLPLGFNHPLLARQHLVCAAAELALQAGERYAGLNGLSEMIQQLARQRVITRKTATRQWIATQLQPQRRMRLRFFEPAFAVIRQPDRRFITRLEPQRAFREAFEGAIYHHGQDESFQVERYLEEQRRIVVRPIHSVDHTRAQINARIDKKHIHDALSTPTYRVTYGTLIYTETIRTFERLTPQHPARVSRYALPNHQRQFQTEGIWFDFGNDEDVLVQADRTAIHTFLHAVLASIRLIVACSDSAYNGILWQDNEAPVTCLSAVIVDLQRGGNGVSACLYQARERILRAALQMLLQCDCEHGRKHCIERQDCDVCQDAAGLDRQAGVRLLQKMLGDIAPSLDSIKPVLGVTGRPSPHDHAQQASHDIYLSLCTRKSADEVGGWQHKHLLGLAVAVTYDTYDNEYRVFKAEGIEYLVDSLRKADRVIGFNLRDFDYQVLQPYTDLPLAALPTLAILDDIRQAVGFRLGLSHLIKETLGADRPDDSLQTLHWFQQGDWQRLIQYCKRDIEFLRRLVRHGTRTGSVFYGDRRGQRQMVQVTWRPTEYDG